MTNSSLTTIEKTIPIAVAGLIVGKTLETLEPKKQKKKNINPLAL